jgi:hypothetical protein
MRPRVLFLAGLVLGALLGLAFVLAPFTFIPGLVVWTWVIARRPCFVGASGALIGFGVTWLLVIGQASWRCANDATCGQVEVTPWLAVGALLVGAGGALGLATRWRSYHG